MIFELIKILGSWNWNCTCMHAHLIISSIPFHDVHRRICPDFTQRGTQIRGLECRPHLLQ